MFDFFNRVIFKIVKFRSKDFQRSSYLLVDELEREREVEQKRLEVLQRKRHRDIIVLTIVTASLGVAMLVVLLMN